MIELILGGARSGKSGLAEARARDAEAAGAQIIYIATAQAGDAEMSARIAIHQSRRPSRWALIETPLQLADTLHDLAKPDCFLLVDCLTLWLTNLLLQGRAASQVEQGQPVDCALFTGEREKFLAVLPNLPGQIVLVSNEVGWGIVPLGAVSRLFADEQGRLNQAVARLAQQVTLVAAGLALPLKAAEPFDLKNLVQCTKFN